jgi:hypothetical protein
VRFFTAVMLFQVNCEPYQLNRKAKINAIRPHIHPEAAFRPLFTASSSLWMLNFTCLLKVNFNALTFECQSEKLTSQATSISTSTFCESLLRQNQLLPKKLEVPSLTLLP